ncbi:MAG: hypothetical protein WC518_04050, partial [Patescibacteria group bacterium]
ASNYLSLSSYFATTTWAGGNNNLVVSGNVTSTSLWLGGAGTANNLDMTNDLYVADDVEIDGSLWVQSATTTDSLYVGGYASSTGGLFTKGNGHFGGNLKVDGNTTTTGQFEANSVLYAKDGNVGVGIDPTTLPALGLSIIPKLTSIDTVAETSGAAYSNFLSTTFSPASDSTLLAGGLIVDAKGDGANHQSSVYGITLGANYEGTASLTTLVALQTTAELANAGSVTSTVAVNAKINNGLEDTDGGGDMTSAVGINAEIELGTQAGIVGNYVGFHALAPVIDGGAITNTYGLLVEDINNASAMNYAIWTNDGQVRLDNSAATTTLYVTGKSYFSGHTTTTGNLTASGVYSETTASAANVYVDTDGKLMRSTSGRKYKTDIDYEGVSGDLLYQLQPASYKDKNTGQEYIGFVAEDVALVEPRLVLLDKEGNPDALHYGNFSALITKAVQDLARRVDSLVVSNPAGETAGDSSPLPVIDQPDSAIDRLVVRQAAEFYGTIYVYGEADFIAKVTFKKHVYFDEDAAGVATIQPNATSTEIVFKEAYEEIPIINVTPKGNTGGRNYWVADENLQGFRIVIEPAADSEFKFNWQAVAVKGNGAVGEEETLKEVTVISLPPVENEAVETGPEDSSASSSNELLDQLTTDQAPEDQSEPQEPPAEALVGETAAEPVQSENQLETTTNASENSKEDTVAAVAAETPVNTE